MGRVNHEANVAVSQVALIFEGEIQWVFRQQPISDVGIDAIIEESINGNPTGRFLAAQIKSRSHEFIESKQHLTLSISNIHYNYWTNNDFPIVMIVYNPIDKKTIWEVIDKAKLKPTNKQWKIDIPRTKFLNVNSKIALTKLLKERNNSITLQFSRKNLSELQNSTNNLTSEEAAYILEQDIKCINVATKTIVRLSTIIDEFGESLKNENIVLLKCSEDNYDRHHPKVVAVTETIARIINLSAQRMEFEINIFSEHFSMGVFAFYNASKRYYDLTGDIKLIKNTCQSLSTLEAGIKIGIDGIKTLDTPSIGYSNNLDNAYNNLSLVVRLIINELGVATEVANNIGNSLLEIFNYDITSNDSI